MALLGNLDFMEIVIIGAGALMIFGKRLPEVAVRLATQVAKLRRSVTQVWRDAGMEEELRKVKRTIEHELPNTAQGGYQARNVMRDIEAKIQAPPPAREEPTEPPARSGDDDPEPSPDDDGADRESA